LSVLKKGLPENFLAINLALLLAGTQEYQEAIQLTQAALEICHNIGDKHPEAAMLNHLSELCHADGQMERSMEYLINAIRIFAEIGVEDGVLTPQIWMLSEW
jgi:uncharacterized tellurite resistance protein B-like protein